MGKPKSKNEVVAIEPLSPPKPLVKEFVDTQKNVTDFILIHAPHHPRSTPHLKQVFQSKDKLTFRFRVNYWTTVDHGESFISTGQIVKSLYVEVVETSKGYTYRDITGVLPEE